MPILDVEIVRRPGEPSDPRLARRLADAAGDVLGTPAGRTWVRLRELPAASYAENGGELPDDVRPVFVQVLHFAPPDGEARAREAAALASRLGAACGRGAEHVHVLYLPAARGRIAFGGTLRE